MLQQMQAEKAMREHLARVEAKVCLCLRSRVLGFRLSLRGDGLLLEGWTRTYYAKQLAQHVVMQAIDLPICANEIEVI